MKLILIAICFGVAAQESWAQSYNPYGFYYNQQQQQFFAPPSTTTTPAPISRINPRFYAPTAVPSARPISAPSSPSQSSGAQLKALLNQDENEDIDLDQAKGLLSQLFKTAKKLLANVDEETLSSLIDDE